MAKIGYLQITRVCNNDCIYCSNPENGKIINLDEIKKGLNNLKDSGYNQVILTGGEPTLNPHIFDAIKYANKIKIFPRLITNGSFLSDENYVKKLKENGIYLVNLSVYTYKQKINDIIRGTKGAYINMIKAMLNLGKYNIETQITTVISKYNQNDLYKTLLFIKKINPNITHFVYNIMDPLMMKQTKEALLSIPDLNLISSELIKSFKFLESQNCTFRIERIPLCKIHGFEWANTEARKFAKNESRKVIFLDDRGELEQDINYLRYGYDDNCKNCELKSICSGIYQREKYYSTTIVEPIKDKAILQKIISKIKNE